MTRVITAAEYRRRFSLTEPKNEYYLQKEVCHWIKSKYGNVWYLSNWQGVYTTKTSAKKMQQITRGKGWSDLFLFVEGRKEILALEIKEKGEKLIREKDCTKPLIVEYKNIKGNKFAVHENKIRKAGDWWNLHIEAQADMLERQDQQFYNWASFGAGLQHCITLVDAFMERNKSLFAQHQLLHKEQVIKWQGLYQKS